MTFVDAYKRLVALANGEFSSIGYEVCLRGHAVLKQECKLYMHGVGMVNEGTWETAFAALEVRMISQAEKAIPLTVEKVTQSEPE